MDNINHFSLRVNDISIMADKIDSPIVSYPQYFTLAQAAEAAKKRIQPEQPNTLIAFHKFMRSVHRLCLQLLHRIKHLLRMSLYLHLTPFTDELPCRID